MNIMNQTVQVVILLILKGSLPSLSLRYQPHPLHKKWGGDHLDGHIAEVQCLDTGVTRHCSGESGEWATSLAARL